MTQPTIITLTLPTPEGGGIAPERATATLLIQRGTLAHVQQFPYRGVIPDLLETLQQAMHALSDLEDQPPSIPDLPEEKPKPARSTPKPSRPDSEPTLDIPLKKGTKAVKISHLKLIGGETDAAAYQQAMQLAGKLIDGQLWDGASPIRIGDVHALAKKMKHLTPKDLSLFSLTDFVQTEDSHD